MAEYAGCRACKLYATLSHLEDFETRDCAGNSVFVGSSQRKRPDSGHRSLDSQWSAKRECGRRASSHPGSCKSYSAKWGDIADGSKCLISIIYVVLHGIAAKYNDPVSEVRPLDRKLHAVCFILARLALVCWMIDLVATCVMVARPDAGQARNARRTQIAELVASIIGL